MKSGSKVLGVSRHSIIYSYAPWILLRNLNNYPIWACIALPFYKYFQSSSLILTNLVGFYFKSLEFDITSPFPSSYLSKSYENWLLISSCLAKHSLPSCSRSNNSYSWSVKLYLIRMGSEFGSVVATLSIKLLFVALVLWSADYFNSSFYFFMKLHLNRIWTFLFPHFLHEVVRVWYGVEPDGDASAGIGDS